MLLPTGTEKRDAKLYEEVTVPPSAPAQKLPCETARVAIDSLDEVNYFDKTVTKLCSFLFVNTQYCVPFRSVKRLLLE